MMLRKAGALLALAWWPRPPGCSALAGGDKAGGPGGGPVVLRMASTCLRAWTDIPPVGGFRPAGGRAVRRDSPDHGHQPVG